MNLLQLLDEEPLDPHLFLLIADQAEETGKEAEAAAWRFVHSKWLCPWHSQNKWGWAFRNDLLMDDKDTIPQKVWEKLLLQEPPNEIGGSFTYSNRSTAFMDLVSVITQERDLRW